MMKGEDGLNSVDVGFGKRGRDGLEVYWRGPSGRLVVVPESSNVVRIVIVPRDV